MKNTFKHSLQPSNHDHRDWNVDSIYYKAIKMPEKFDWLHKLNSIRNQGQQGSCSAMTAAVLKEIHERKELGYTGYMSPQFVYNLRSNKLSEGMTPRDTMRILQRTGIVLENQYPYGMGGTITRALRRDAGNFRIKHYAKVRDIFSAKAALMSDGALYTGFPVYNMGNKFWRQETPNQQMEGGHAVAIVGWDKNGFIIRNSWGTEWGCNGYSYYPYEDWGMHWEIWTTIDDTSCQERLEEIVNRTRTNIFSKIFKRR